MASQQLEASIVQKEFESGVIASGSAFINPRVENTVVISLELFKKCNEPQFSDIKLNVKAGYNGAHEGRDMNKVIADMPADTKELVVEKFLLSPNSLAIGDKLTFELVEKAFPSQGGFLVCLGTNVEVIPTPAK